MRAINANTVDISTSWLPSVRVLGDLRAGVITYRNVIREHMLGETLEEKLAMEKTLATVIESNTKIRAAYEPLITSAEERALYNEWAQAVGKLPQGHPGGHGAVPQGGRPDSHEAHRPEQQRRSTRSGSRPMPFSRRSIDLNNAGADKAAQDAAASYVPPS